jgi:hypothetical protein
MLESTSDQFRKFFLLFFTQELIKNNYPSLDILRLEKWVEKEEENKLIEKESEKRLTQEKISSLEKKEAFNQNNLNQKKQEIPKPVNFKIPNVNQNRFNQNNLNQNNLNQKKQEIPKPVNFKIPNVNQNRFNQNNLNQNNLNQKKQEIPKPVNFKIPNVNQNRFNQNNLNQKKQEIPKPVNFKIPNVNQNRFNQNNLNQKEIDLIRPTPNPEESIELNKIDNLIKDPFVKTIECPGRGKNLLVTGKMGRKMTRIILTSEEINEILNKFSKATKIPVNDGFYKVAYGNLIFFSRISNLICISFEIKKIPPLRFYSN